MGGLAPGARPAAAEIAAAAVVDAAEVVGLARPAVVPAGFVALSGFGSPVLAGPAVAE